MIKKFNNFEKINESVEDYLKDIYECGGMSSDVYSTTIEEGLPEFSGSESEVKLQLLEWLYSIGGISTDVYILLKEEL